MLEDQKSRSRLFACLLARLISGTKVQLKEHQLCVCVGPEREREARTDRQAEACVKKQSTTYTAYNVLSWTGGGADLKLYVFSTAKVIS